MKFTTISIIIAVVLIGGALLLTRSNGAANNVTIIDGKQIVDITAKGRYSPRVSLAKADVPTTLRVETNGTFDCTAGLTIPAINYRANLPPSGVTEIEIPSQKPGTTLQGLCVMGMYNFKVKFN
ncbi:MAG: cupredoxin domain-containing protein [bacterium]|nr:cupredoxin domain-containing protein [bacterium]